MATFEPPYELGKRPDQGICLVERVRLRKLGAARCLSQPGRRPAERDL